MSNSRSSQSFDEDEYERRTKGWTHTPVDHDYEASDEFSVDPCQTCGSKLYGPRQKTVLYRDRRHSGGKFEEKTVRSCDDCVQFMNQGYVE